MHGNPERQWRGQGAAAHFLLTTSEREETRSFPEQSEPLKQGVEESQLCSHRRVGLAQFRPERLTSCGSTEIVRLANSLPGSSPFPQRSLLDLTFHTPPRPGPIHPKGNSSGTNRIPVGASFEGGINLSDLNLQTECFSSFMLRRALRSPWT